MAAVCSRPLKKHRLCAPDVYPQEHLQKEDELSEENVKKGFTFQPLFKFNLSEYGSAKDIVSNVPLSKFAQSFNAVRHEKVKLNTFQDSNKRKSQIVKENFWNVTARSRSHIASWFQDLTGNKPLTLLAKKVPIFNKKEEIFSSLCDYAVPLLRAAWFIKMTSAYYNAISEPKVKKRIAQDPAQEWTHVLTKYLREQLMKLSDFYHQHFASQHQPRMTSDVEQAQKQWNYTIRLANWLYEESLLDRQEFLQWLLDLLDKGKMGDDVLLKLLIPLVLKYVDQIVLSQTLARNLGQVCTRKLASLYSAAEQMQSEQQQQQNATSSSGPKTPTMNAPSPLSTSSESVAPPTSTSSAQQPIINQYKNCPQHQALLLAFSSLLETITICCPGALVWNSAPCSSGSNSSNDNGANKLNVLGSPLDRIPIAVSDLPLPSSVSGIRTNLNQELTAAIMASEEEIKTRSKAVENQWSPDKYEDKTSSLAVKQLLDTLEILDKFNFNKTEAGSSVDILYLKIFPNSSKGSMQVSETDQAVSLLLCEWAVSKHRVGKHRVLVVAKLLQKRQMDLQDEVEDNVSDTGDDTASSAVSVQTQSLPPFQKVLLNFLDNYAPVVDDYQHHKGDPSFAQLILLFGELIRHDVFSHNAYLHTLIARGDLQPPPVVSVPSPPKPTLDPSLNTSGLSEQLGTEVCVQEGDATGIVDLTIPGIINVKEDEGENKRETSDSEFKLNQELDQELLLHQERLQQLLDQGDNESFLEDSQLMQPLSTTLSVDGIKLDGGHYSSINLNRRDSTLTDSSGYSKKTQHVQYATHFPIPQDSATQHECNQRLILLYGVGRARSEAIATVKEVNKLLLNKLQELGNVPTSQRNSREYAKCSSSAELSAKRAQEEQRANLYGKFTSLSGFDQYNTVAKCASVLRDTKAAQPNYFGLGGPLPVIDQLVFLFDLFELSGDIHGLLDFIVQALMPQEEKVMHSAVPQTTSVFGTLPNKSITVVAILRRYHAFLMTLPQHTARVFRGLLQTVENIADPGVCTSSERCILAYLFDLYSGCAHLRTRYSDIFSYAHTRIKQSVCASNNPSVSTEQFDLKFMAEYFQNPRTKRLDRIWEYLRSYDRRADVYSFVCNALMNVCNCQSSERLFDIGVLCAEVTSHFGRLCSEWLGVLKALCCSSNSSLGFVDLLLEVDVGDLSIHESVATFTALLISRRSLSLEDVIYHVALSSLKAALPGSDNNQDAESGARLTCHLLLRLLDESTDFMSHDHSEATKFPFKSSPDHYLLTAAHENISVTALLAVLKAMLKLSESGRTNDLGNNETSRDELFRSTSFSSRLYGFMDSAGDIFPPPMSSSKSAMETSNTSAFAGYALQVICGQEWVREKCLQDLQAICSPKLLLDPALTANQARKLLHLICYPAGVPMSLGGTIPLLSSSSEMESAQEAASRILQNLDQWSLRKSWLELQLMIRQASKEETSSLLDAIATGAMNVFVQWHGATPLATARSNQRRGVIKGPEWLVAPLISKLSNLVQGRLLKAAGDVLDSPRWWKEHKEHGSKKSGCALVHTQPFLSLVLACLKGQEDQRGGLLSSISRQLSKLLAAPVEERCPVASKGKEALQEALHLRLSLVGAMFDTLHRNAQLAAEWAVVLFQLVSSGTITADSFPNKRELLPNVLDMVSVLISVVANSGESSGTQSAEESRKATATLFKKLKRELAGKNPSDITQCKELLPLPSLSYNVMTVEPVRESSEVVSEKPSTSPLPQGLVVQGKQKIGAWELMEGHKNPAPLAWAWFGAVKIERKPLKYEQEFRKLMHHTHPMRKPLSYYINPAPDDEEEEEDEEEEDEDEDEEDKMDADESGADKSSQPSTPFTPVESKGQAPKPLGNPATPSSVAASAQIVPSSLTQDQIEATGNKQVKAKTQRQRRRPSRTQGVATQQRKQQQLKQQQQQQQYLQQQQQQQQQPGMYMTQPGQPLPQQMNQGQFYQQMSSANTLPGQAQLTVPSRVGTTMGSMDSKTALQSMLATRNIQGNPQLQRLFALKKQQQAKQQQQQQQSTQCLYPNLTQQLQQPAMQPLQLQGSQMQQTQLPQQLQRPIQQPQQQTQRLGHLPQTQHSTVRSNQGSVMRPSQQFSFSQAQRAQLPTSLQIPNRTQVATRPTIASTPTPTTPTIGSMVSSGPNITAQFSNNTFAGLSQTMTRQLAPQQQAQQQQPQQQQQQQQQFTVQNQHSLPGSAVVQRRNQLTASAVGLQMSQASQMQQGLQQQFQSNVGRVNVQQTQQQQQLLRQHLQQRQQQQQAAAARQQQNTQMNTDFIRQLSQMSGGSQDTLSSLERQFSNQELASIQRQLSAPAEMGLQRQVSTGQDISQFQRQLSTPGPQELPQQQQQQFPGNPQFQGQF